MLQLPPRFATVILSFAPLFCQRRWRHAEVLLLGAILAPGRRTVASLLRITGVNAFGVLPSGGSASPMAEEPHFVNYHRVLNRAVWNPRAAAAILLRLLLAAFVPQGAVVLGLDDPIERWRGARREGDRP